MRVVFEKKDAVEAEPKMSEPEVPEQKKTENEPKPEERDVNEEAPEVEMEELGTGGQASSSSGEPALPAVRRVRVYPHDPLKDSRKRKSPEPPGVKRKRPDAAEDADGDETIGEEYVAESNEVRQVAGLDVCQAEIPMPLYSTEAMKTVLEERIHYDDVFALEARNKEQRLPPLDTYKEYEKLPLSNFEGVYGTISGELLPAPKVREGRLREVWSFVQLEVFWDELDEMLRDCKTVASKWLDDWKTDDDIKSRLVAMEIAWDLRDDCFAGTPPLKCLRLVISLAASKPPKKKNGERRRVIGIWDVSVAFMHAVMTAKICIIPPNDLRRAGRKWRLRKAVNGTRAASRSWAEEIHTTVNAEHFDKVVIVPNFWVNQEMDVSLGAHGDDFHAEGEPEDILTLESVQKWQCKRIVPIGPGYENEGKILKRSLKWSPKGVELEPDRKHVINMARKLHLTDTKGSETPGSKTTGVGVRDVLDALPAGSATTFRSCSGIGVYLPMDRWGIQYALSQILKDLKTPTAGGMLRLRKLVKYLVAHPDIPLYFVYQELPSELIGHSDSDWAGEATTRKSVSSGCEELGLHMVFSWVNSQWPIALSSAEAEFYALGTCASHCLMTKNLLGAFGHQGHREDLRRLIGG